MMPKLSDTDEEAMNAIMCGQDILTSLGALSESLTELRSLGSAACLYRRSNVERDISEHQDDLRIRIQQLTRLTPDVKLRQDLLPVLADLGGSLVDKSARSLRIIEDCADAVRCLLVSRTREDFGPTLPVRLHGMTPQDIDEAHVIEEASFAYPWSKEDFRNCLDMPSCDSIIAGHGNMVSGFALYELSENTYHILKLAVHPDYRKLDIGTQMIQKMKHELKKQQYEYLTLEVGERNIRAQKFFRSLDFKVTQVLRDRCRETSDDAYRMECCQPLER